MSKLQKIEDAIAAKKEAIAKLKKEGDHKIGFWIDKSANKSGRVYYRARWLEAKKVRSYQIKSPEELAQWRAEITRGNWIHNLTCDLEELEADRRWIIREIRRLGGTGIRLNE